MTGHIGAYRALSEERRESLWFKWFQSSAMSAKREEEAKTIQTLVDDLKVSRYQVLDLVDQIMSQSREAYWGLLKGSRLHRPVVIYSQRLQGSRDYQRVALVHAGTRYDYWDLMSRQSMAGVEARLTQLQTDNNKKLYEAHMEVTTARKEAREAREEARAVRTELAGLRDEFYRFFNSQRGQVAAEPTVPAAESASEQAEAMPSPRS